MNCPKCGSGKVWKTRPKKYKDGSTGQGYQCGDCKKYFTVKSDGTLNTRKKAIIIKDVDHGNDHVPKRLGISIDEIIRTHDVDELIKQGLKKIEKGTLFTEHEFIDVCGIRGKSYRSALETPEMKKNKCKIDGVIYYGTTEDIDYLKYKKYIAK